MVYSSGVLASNFQINEHPFIWKNIKYRADTRSKASSRGSFVSLYILFIDSRMWAWKIWRESEQSWLIYLSDLPWVGEKFSEPCTVAVYEPFAILQIQPRPLMRQSVWHNENLTSKWTNDSFSLGPPALLSTFQEPQSVEKRSLVGQQSSLVKNLIHVWREQTCLSLWIMFMACSLSYCVVMVTVFLFKICTILQSRLSQLHHCQRLRIQLPFGCPYKRFLYNAGNTYYDICLFSQVK